jgi:hypothetical protein
MSRGRPTNVIRRHDKDPAAYAEGRMAQRERAPIDRNPYERGTTQHLEWSRGWRTADKNKLTPPC